MEIRIGLRIIAKNNNKKRYNQKYLEEAVAKIQMSYRFVGDGQIEARFYYLDDKRGHPSRVVLQPTKRSSFTTLLHKENTPKANVDVLSGNRFLNRISLEGITYDIIFSKGSESTD